MTDMSVADVLERAADLLWMHGRANGFGIDCDGRMCVEGAMCYAQGLDPNDWAALEDSPAMRPAIEALGDYVNDLVWAWNDHTEDDALVIDTLKRCAKELREEAS